MSDNFNLLPPPQKKTVIGVSIGTGGEGVVQIETLVRRTGWVIAGLVAFAGLVVGCYGTACEDCETQTSNLLMVWSETPSRDISCWCHPLTVFLICVLDQIFGWSTVFHVTVGMATWCPPPQHSAGRAWLKAWPSGYIRSLALSGHHTDTCHHRLGMGSTESCRTRGTAGRRRAPSAAVGHPARSTARWTRCGPVAAAAAAVGCRTARHPDHSKCVCSDALLFCGGSWVSLRYCVRAVFPCPRPCDMDAESISDAGISFLSCVSFSTSFSFSRRSCAVRPLKLSPASLTCNH